MGVSGSVGDEFSMENNVGRFGDLESGTLDVIGKIAFEKCDQGEALRILGLFMREICREIRESLEPKTISGKRDDDKFLRIKVLYTAKLQNFCTQKAFLCIFLRIKNEETRRKKVNYS